VGRPAVARTGQGNLGQRGHIRLTEDAIQVLQSEQGDQRSGQVPVPASEVSGSGESEGFRGRLSAADIGG
jgi:hypothetical protein